MNKIDKILFGFGEKLKESKWSAIGSIPLLILVFFMIVTFPMESLAVGLLITLVVSVACFINLMIEFFD